MLNVGDNWKCPHCGHAQVLDEKRIKQRWHQQYVEGWKHGKPAIFFSFVVCANSDCRELVLEAAIAPYTNTGTRGEIELDAPVATWKLLPPSSAKPQPDYIPEPIRNDYFEACAIRDLSPKASATIIRR